MIFSWWKNWRHPGSYRHLRPGRFYRLGRAFTDYDGLVHHAGQRWRFIGHGFVPYEDGLTLRFVTEAGEDRIVRLQLRPESQGDLVEALATVFVPCEAPQRSARAGLRTVTDRGLVVFDGVDQLAVPWKDITKITVALGQQHYDMTLCIEVDHRQGTSIFLPQVEPSWEPFLAGCAQHLKGVLPRQDWESGFIERPEQTVRIYPRRSRLR